MYLLSERNWIIINWIVKKLYLPCPCSLDIKLTEQASGSAHLFPSLTCPGVAVAGPLSAEPQIKTYQVVEGMFLAAPGVQKAKESIFHLRFLRYII